jgi:plasmid stability protein
VAGKRASALDMCCTCKYAESMTKMIQVRNVPAELHRKLKSRAALQGMSLSDYLLREIQQIAERPTLQELAARLDTRTPVKYQISPARILREERSRR